MPRHNGILLTVFFLIIRSVMVTPGVRLSHFTLHGSGSIDLQFTVSIGTRVRQHSHILLRYDSQLAAPLRGTVFDPYVDGKTTKTSAQYILL